MSLGCGPDVPAACVAFRKQIRCVFELAAANTFLVFIVVYGVVPYHIPYTIPYHTILRSVPYHTVPPFVRRTDAPNSSCACL